MELNHIGIINTNEEQALRFYRDFLGLEKTREITIAPELSEQIFSLSREIKILVFEHERIKIEVFISDFKPAHPNFIHFSITVDNLADITKKAEQSQVNLIIGKHKEKTACFLKDFSGNLIEVKEKA